MTNDEIAVRQTAAMPAAPSPHTITLRVAARSECGPVRANNEDRFLAVRVERITTPVATNIENAKLHFLPQQAMWALAVADGMGGHAAGEIASTLSLSLLLQFSQQGSRWFVSIGEEEARVIAARIEGLLQSVDKTIAAEAEDHPAWDGMGSTITAAVVIEGCLFLCQVGDSRAYLLRQGRLERLTHDQTLAQELVDSGVLPLEQASSHPTRHILTQALGRGDVTLRVQRFQLEPGDRLILTTDGVTDVLPDARIAELTRVADPHTACDQLLEQALAARTRDNVTVVVADVEADEKALGSRL
jgi:serine/threonine protein phosphatase PrpC